MFFQKQSVHAYKTLKPTDIKFLVINSGSNKGKYRC